MPQTPVNRDDARRRAATGLAATALVTDVAQRLAEAGIAVMPVKGALLQHWLYDDPSERPLTDVDLLVRPEDFDRAVAQLETGGYRRALGSSIGAAVMETPFGLPLDLHPRLFDRARYRLPTRELFARSSENHVLYGVSVRLPSALDVYAHLVGKFGSDHLDACATARLDEIARMGFRLRASPETTARHLVHCGMRRVSLYVLPLVHRLTADPFALQVCRRLPFDPVGRALVAVADPVLAAASPDSRKAALMAHLLNESLPRGARSGLRALLQRPQRGAKGARP
ncbi:MAG: nucleotidyltransferase family protein [Polyangiales bacterium]